MAQSEVTSSAQEPSNSAGRMAVIDRENSICRFFWRPTADSAKTFLLGHDPVKYLRRNAVDAAEIIGPSARLLAAGRRLISRSLSIGFAVLNPAFFTLSAIAICVKLGSGVFADGLFDLARRAGFGSDHGSLLNAVSLGWLGTASCSRRASFCVHSIIK